ncbi:MAG: CvpA family protein [Bacillota bacterium]
MDNLPTIVDGIVILVFLGFGILGYRLGLMRSLLRFAPMLLAMFAARFLTPAMATFFRGTFLYGMIMSHIEKIFFSEASLEQVADKIDINLGEREYIEQLNLPEFLTEALVSNNNSVVHSLLHVETLQEYITGFLASMCLNVIAMILIFIAVYIGAVVLLNGLHLVSQLPFLNLCNRLLGGVVGLLKGVIFIWIAFVCVFYLQCNGKFLDVGAAVVESSVAVEFYRNNWLLMFLLTIFN